MEFRKITTQRCLEVSEYLIENKFVKNEKELCDIIQFTQKSLFNVRKGKAFFTQTNMNWLVYKFKVDPRYIMPPYNKEMFLRKSSVSELNMLLREREKIKKDLERINNTIKFVRGLDENEVKTGVKIAQKN